MFEVNFYIWFLSSWAYVGIVLGYFSMKRVLRLVNKDDKNGKEKSIIVELEKPCGWIGKVVGVSPVKILFLFVYAICILLWPYLLFMRVKNIFKRKK